MSRKSKPLSICNSCPWLTTNHGKKHPAKWYSKANIHRLWSGIRTGKASGVLCHTSDPHSDDYGGEGKAKPGKERECVGALLLVFQNMNAIADGRPQPFNPPLTKRAIARFAERFVFWGMPSVENRTGEVSLPWE